MDQLISAVSTRLHSILSPFYFDSCGIASLLLLSSLALVPAWARPVELVNNTTETVSPYCSMDEVFGEEFYDWEVLARMWVPLASLGVMALATVFLLSLRVRHGWSMKKVRECGGESLKV